MKKQTLGGVVFECVRAGLWVTPDRRYAIVEQMHGRLEHEWLLFRTNLHELSTNPISPPVDLEDADFWSGWQIGHHFTMGELAHDIACEFLTNDQIERVRRAMLGVPRKNSYHRAILKDCGAALEGDTACRSSVARAWLKLHAPADNVPNIFDDLFDASKASKPTKRKRTGIGDRLQAGRHWEVIAVLANGHGLGHCAHHHATKEEATRCAWRPDNWEEHLVCDLLVRELRCECAATPLTKADVVTALQAGAVERAAAEKIRKRSPRR